MEIDVNNRMYLTMVKYGKRIESTYHFNMAYETEEQFDTYVNKAGDIRVQFCVPYNSSPEDIDEYDIHLIEVQEKIADKTGDKWVDVLGKNASFYTLDEALKALSLVELKTIPELDNLLLDDKYIVFDSLIKELPRFLPIEYVMARPDFVKQEDGSRIAARVIMEVRTYLDSGEYAKSGWYPETSNIIDKADTRRVIRTFKDMMNNDHDKSRTVTDYMKNKAISVFNGGEYADTVSHPEFSEISSNISERSEDGILTVTKRFAIEMEREKAREEHSTKTKNKNPLEELEKAKKKAERESENNKPPQRDNEHIYSDLSPER